MADLSWAATSPLSRALVSGRRGAKAGAPGVTLTEFHDFELAQVMARRGQRQAVADAAKSHSGLMPPERPQIVRTQNAALIWSGPDQFFVLSPRQNGVPALPALRDVFAGKASLSDQSDGRVLLQISGLKARDTLAKFCSLDLYSEAFPQGSSAATSIDHTSVNLWRGADASDGTPAFFLLVFSTFAESLLGMILDSAAEHGVEVSPRTAYVTSDA